MHTLRYPHAALSTRYHCAERKTAEVCCLGESGAAFFSFSCEEEFRCSRPAAVGLVRDEDEKMIPVPHFGNCFVERVVGVAVVVRVQVACLRFGDAPY